MSKAMKYLEMAEILNKKEEDCATEFDRLMLVFDKEEARRWIAENM